VLTPSLDVGKEKGTKISLALRVCGSAREIMY